MKCARWPRLLKNQVRTGEFWQENFFSPSKPRIHFWPKATLLETGAGDGNRTHVRSLGSFYSAIELHPRLFFVFYFIVKTFSTLLCLVFVLSPVLFIQPSHAVIVHDTAGQGEFFTLLYPADKEVSV